MAKRHLASLSLPAFLQAHREKRFGCNAAWKLVEFGNRPKGAQRS